MASAFDRDLRSEELLGQSETDRNGAYHIEYSRERFKNRERSIADLQIKAFDASGTLLIASSMV